VDEYIWKDIRSDNKAYGKILKDTWSLWDTRSGRGIFEKSALGFGSIALSSLLGPLTSSLLGMICLGGAPQNNLGGLFFKGTTHFSGKGQQGNLSFSNVADLHNLKPFDYIPNLGKMARKEIPTHAVQREPNEISW